MIRRRASILLETVIAITMLAIAVPVTVTWMQGCAADRTDATSSLRASAMATAIAEHIIADAASSSTGLGMTALQTPSVYLDTPTTGLRARLATLLTPYTTAHFSYDITIGGLVGPEGTATGNSLLDVCRLVTLTINFPSARGGTLHFTLELMVASS